MTISLVLIAFFFVEEVFAVVFCLIMMTVMMRVTVRLIGWMVVVERDLAGFTHILLQFFAKSPLDTELLKTAVVSDCRTHSR